MVEENQAGSRPPGQVEDVANTLFRLAQPLGEQLRPLNRNKVDASLAGERMDQEGLPGSGRSVEKHAQVGGEAELGECIGVTKRFLDELRQPGLERSQAADVVPGYTRVGQQ